MAATWQFETVDSVGDMGHWSSLAVATGGWPRIAYTDDTKFILKYATRDVAGWHSETVDNNGFVGYFPSLALDAADQPHIAYEQSGIAIKYAYHDGPDGTSSSWITRTASVGRLRWR